MKETEFQLIFADSPTDYESRLVFADWLEERGDIRAVLVRLIEAVRTPVEAREPPPSEEWAALEQAVPLKPTLEKLSPHRKIAWAVDCAEAVIPLFEVRNPDEKSLRLAIEAMRNQSWKLAVQLAIDAREVARTRASGATTAVSCEPDVAAARAAHHAAHRRVAAATGAARKSRYWSFLPPFLSLQDANKSCELGEQGEYRWQLLRLACYQCGLIPIAIEDGGFH